MERVPLGHRSKESRQQKSGGNQTKILLGKDLLKDLEQRRSSPSVVAKLMGIDVLPPAQVARKNQEFKDVFEVSEPSEVTRERNRHVGKGLPSLKRSTLKLKKLVPAKSPSSDETFNNNVEWRDGLDRLNSLERTNPLFEKRPHDLMSSPNHHLGKAAVSTFRKHPVGLAHSPLQAFRSSLHHEATTRGMYDNSSSIVVLEPALEKACDPENIFSALYLPDISKVCRRDREQKQSEFLVVQKGKVPRHLLDNEDIKRERCLSNNAIDPPYPRGQNSFAQFGAIQTISSGSSQRYSSCGSNSNPKENSMSSTGTFSRKINRQCEHADGGSKTLAEMFALSDSERPKRSSDSHVLFRHDKTDHDNTHNHEGCFIVLPKCAPYSHPSPLHSHSPWDRNTVVSNPDLLMSKDMRSLRADMSSHEGSPQIGNFPKRGIHFDNGKLQVDIFQDEPRHLKHKTSIGQENLRNVVGPKHFTAEKPKLIYPSHLDSTSGSWRLADSFSAPDCINEKVLFTTYEGLVQKPADYAPVVKDLKLTGEEQKVTASPFKCQEVESLTHLDYQSTTKHLKGLKEVEQPSPVSILEPPTDEDSCSSGYFKYDSCSSGYFKYDMEEVPDIPKRLHGLQLQDESEVSMSSDDNDSVDQSLEAFIVEEDRDFSFLLDILISSGFIVANFELFCKSWHSPDCPVNPHVLDRLERKYNNTALTWSRPERRLLFDHVNAVLLEVLAPCIDTHPWVVRSRAWIKPIWGPEGPVEKVWQMLVRQREELAAGHWDDKVLDPKWMDVGDDINVMGKQISRMFYDGLLEEVIEEFISRSVAS